jgi:nuclear pore complex protein Nup54
MLLPANRSRVVVLLLESSKLPSPLHSRCAFPKQTTMSLFGNLGNNTQQQPAGGSLFGNANNNNNTQSSQPAQPTSLFGQAQPAQSNTTPSLFGGATQQNQQNQQQSSTPSLFGGAAPQQTSTPSLFGASAQQTQQQQQQPQQQQQQQQSGGMFGSTNNNNAQPQQNASLFGQPAQQSNSLFAQPTNEQNQQQQPGMFGTNNANSLGASLLSASMSALPSALVNKPTTIGFNQQSMAPPRDKTIPQQIESISQKWNPETAECMMQHYFYVQVPPEQTPFISMPPNADEREWEKALRNKPTPGSVPVIAKGFEALGTRLKTQVEAVKQLQMRLHEMNNSLGAMMQKHELVLSVRAAEAKRKHIGLSQRCLALAVRAQVLANRGFVLDGAEEELKKKLATLEKAVFDPAFSGREEEIWARMVAIRERTRWLQEESEKLGRQITGENGGLDEQVIEKAKKVRCLQPITYTGASDANIINRFSETTTHRSSTCAKRWTRSRRSTRNGRLLANLASRGTRRVHEYDTTSGYAFRYQSSSALSDCCSWEQVIAQLLNDAM